MPIGAPLAGYNYPPRRTEWWPLPYFTNYTTWMNPSLGTWDPNYAKALVIDQDGSGRERFAFITLDAVGFPGTLASLAWEYAKGMGFSVPMERCLFSASHSHSGPGGIAGDFLFTIAPSTDALVPELQELMAHNIAKAMINAERSLEPASMDVGSDLLLGVTHNRMTWSPYVSYGTIDPHLGVIAVNKMNGAPLATLWNFAIHGICFDSGNMKFSSDISGSANQWVEDNVGGVSLFVNGDAGDVNPIFSVCCRNKPDFSGGPVIGKAIQQLRSSLNPTSDDVFLSSSSKMVDFGPTNLNLTIVRATNCTHGGPLDICTLCKVLHCDAPIHLSMSWVSNTAMFNAFRFTIRGKHSVMVSIPGEAIVELGWKIRNDTLDMGFDGTTLLAGYSNNYMGYFTTPNEYVLGGYESLLTLWGIDTSKVVRKGCAEVTSSIAPDHTRTNEPFFS